ncbi:transposase [Ancylostoma ceylanicum]|uniref:Transposase n=1 Tax=Ancylostoma ceylanicum TaxID=53326 RepID=A0A0D6M160_9BILA|nr:transposase [Ancylostoma ceylanicum]
MGQHVRDDTEIAPVYKGGSEWPNHFMEMRTMTATKSSIRERLLHEYQLGHSAAVGRSNVCAAFGQDVLKESTAEFWYKNFREGSTEMKDGHRAAFDNRRMRKQWLRSCQKPIPVPKPSLSQQKVMLCVWWWIGGIIHWELVASGHTIDAETYCIQLQRVNDKMRQAGLRHLFRRGPILQQDNARPHTALQTLEKIQELGWEVLPHPPYSPDAAPSDYHLFKSLQHYLAGKRLTNSEEVKDRLTRFFESKPAQFYRNGIEKLPEL